MPGTQGHNYTSNGEMIILMLMLITKYTIWFKMDNITKDLHYLYLTAEVRLFRVELGSAVNVKRETISEWAGISWLTSPLLPLVAMEMAASLRVKLMVSLLRSSSLKTS